MKFKYSRLPRAAAACALAFFGSSAFADTTPQPLELHVVAWDAPWTNDDGSPLTDLVGYYIYMGASPQTMVPYYFTTSLEQFMVLRFPPGGTRYFGVTAVNVEGVESVMSGIVGQ
jgi:hypothetical protein